MTRKDEFDAVYMKIAESIASLSRCKRAKVGAVIVKNGNIISFGFNGTISGDNNRCEECLPEEYWKDTEYVNYQVSNLGNIKRKECVLTKTFKNRGDNIQTQTIVLPEKILKGNVNKKGYIEVSLCGKKIKLHQLVAKAFIPNPEKDFYNQINHIDGNKTNNNVENLEWCTNRYNCEHRSRSNKNKEALPLGIYKTEKGRKQPYIAKIYSQGKIQSKRVDSIEEGIKFIEFFKDPKEYKTFKYRVEDDLITLPEVIHAECNAILKAGERAEGAEMYLTMSPCVECCKLIKQAKINKVYFRHVYRNVDGLTRLGINYEQI